MKKKVMIAVVTVLLLLSTCVPVLADSTSASSSNALTIEDALNLAYKNNQDVLKARLDTEKTQTLAEKAFEQVTFIPTGGLVESSYQSIMSAYQTAAINAASAKKAEESAKSGLEQEVISAYVKAIKDKNNIKTAQLNLDNMNEQIKLAQTSKDIGTMSSYDLNTMLVSRQKLEDTLKNAKLAYQSDIASLRALVGEGEDWNPDLTSTPVLTQYKRDDLSLEIARGTDQSLTVFNAKQNLDLIKSKENWIDLDTPTNVQKINKQEAEIAYEQAKLDAKSTIEQLYYSIDTLEKQISIAAAAYEQAQKDLQVAQFKYDLGLIPYNSLSSGTQSLTSAKLAVETNRITLENLKADLESAKVSFAYTTGKTVYDADDWTPETDTSSTTTK